MVNRNEVTVALKWSPKEDSIHFDKEKALKNIGNEKIIEIYTNMIRTQKFDEKLEAMCKQGADIVQHNTRGEEGVQIGALSTLEADDYVQPYHRGWGWAIGKGMDPKKMLAEILTKSTGYNSGRAGAQLGDWNLKVMGRPGIQGAHVPIATGIGFGIKMRGTQQVCLCMNGNGACNTANWFEGLSMAGAWKVPVVYLVSNNLYEIYSPILETTGVEDLSLRAMGFGMPGYLLDGNDAIQVHTYVKEAVGNARKGLGPSLIECKTYRHEGHGNADVLAKDGTYRPLDEMNAWLKRDPILTLKKDILEHQIATEEQLQTITSNAEKEMDKAESFANESPRPTLAELLKNNYVD